MALERQEAPAADPEQNHQSTSSKAETAVARWGVNYAESQTEKEEEWPKLGRYET